MATSIDDRAGDSLWRFLDRHPFEAALSLSFVQRLAHMSPAPTSRRTVDGHVLHMFHGAMTAVTTRQLRDRIECALTDAPLAFVAGLAHLSPCRRQAAAEELAAWLAAKLDEREGSGAPSAQPVLFHDDLAPLG